MFSEIFGSGVQHLHYDRAEPDVLFVAAMKDGEYLKPANFVRLCDREELPRVRMHPSVYINVEKARVWADLPSEVSKSHMREGVVITSANRIGVMAKIIGFEYLASKDKKKTERH